MVIDYKKKYLKYKEKYINKKKHLQGGACPGGLYGQAVEELRVGEDGVPHPWEDFVTYYGEEYAIHPWNAAPVHTVEMPPLDELRIAPDGNPYPYSAFETEYGRAYAMTAWNAARVATPSKTDFPSNYELYGCDDEFEQEQGGLFSDFITPSQPQRAPAPMGGPSLFSNASQPQRAPAPMGGPSLFSNASQPQRAPECAPVRQPRMDDCFSAPAAPVRQPRMDDCFSAPAPAPDPAPDPVPVCAPAPYKFAGEDTSDVYINLAGGLVFSLLSAHILDYNHLYKNVNWHCEKNFIDSFLSLFPRIFAELRQVYPEFMPNSAKGCRMPDIPRLDDIFDVRGIANLETMLLDLSSVNTTYELLKTEASSLSDLDTKIHTKLEKSTIDRVIDKRDTKQKFGLARMKYGFSYKDLSNVIGEQIDVGLSMLNNSMISKISHSNLPDFIKFMFEIVVIICNDLFDHKVQKRIRRFVLILTLNDIFNNKLLNPQGSGVLEIFTFINNKHAETPEPAGIDAIVKGGLDKTHPHNLLFEYDSMQNFLNNLTIELIDESMNFIDMNGATAIKQANKYGVFPQIYNPLNPKHAQMPQDIQKALANAKNRTAQKTHINIGTLCNVNKNVQPHLNKPYKTLIFNVNSILEGMHIIKAEYKRAGGTFNENTFLSREDMSDSVLVLAATILEELLEHPVVRTWKDNLVFSYTHMFWIWSFWTDNAVFNQIWEHLINKGAFYNLPQLNIPACSVTAPIIKQNLNVLTLATMKFGAGEIDRLLLHIWQGLPQANAVVLGALKKYIEFDEFQQIDSKGGNNAGIKATLNWVELK